MFNYFITRQKSLLFKLVYDMGIIYSAPSGLSYFWNFGSLALLSLIVQIITGVFLACIILVMLILRLIPLNIL